MKFPRRLPLAVILTVLSFGAAADLAAQQRDTIRPRQDTVRVQQQQRDTARMRQQLQQQRDTARMQQQQLQQQRDTARVQQQQLQQQRTQPGQQQLQQPGQQQRAQPGLVQPEETPTDARRRMRVRKGT